MNPTQSDVSRQLSDQGSRYALIYLHNEPQILLGSNRLDAAPRAGQTRRPLGNGAAMVIPSVRVRRVNLVFKPC